MTPEHQIISIAAFLGIVAVAALYYIVDGIDKGHE